LTPKIALVHPSVMARRRPTHDPKFVVAYMRCSTEGQAEEGLSLDVQREKIAAYAALYGLTIVAWESDALSGKSLDRPGLERALGRIESGDAGGEPPPVSWTV
jgi:hypothetical protein